MIDITKHQAKWEAPEKKLITAAALGDSDLVRHYLDTGLPADAAPSGKPSSLCYAVLGNNSDLAWFLLRHQADVNFKDGLGNTPCIYACLSGSADCLELLLRWGADIKLTNHQQKCAENYCRGCEVYKIIKGASLDNDEPAINLTPLLN